MRLFRKGRRRGITDLLRDQGGATAVLVALSMPLVAGGMGLGAEVGYHYMLQRNLQQAADMAAHAGAVRLRAGDGAAGIRIAARHAAVASGYTGRDENLALNTPPARGAHRGNARSVEVELTMAQPRLFSRIFTDAPVTLRARAVANVTTSTSRACVLALSPTTPRAVTVSGSTLVSLENCDVVTNSNASDAFYMQNASARLTVGCVRSVGGAVTSGGLTLRSCDRAETLAPVVRDPYADVREPAVEGPCMTASKKNDNNFAPNFIHSSGVPALRICGGIDIKRHATFAPGLYIIDGGDFLLNANGEVSPTEASISGNGVTFYLAGNATLTMNGNGSFNLAGPTTGPYAGLLFFGNRQQSGLTHRVLGNSGSVTQGAIYSPRSHVTFLGNSTMSNGCTQIIANTVEFTGNSILRSNCTSNNVREIETRVMVSLVE